MENKNYISLTSTSTLIHKFSSSMMGMRQTEYKYRVCILIQGVRLKYKVIKVKQTK